MTSMDWTQGQLLTLRPGDTASCKGGLNTGQIYGLFFYNSAGAQAEATINVVWSQSSPPVPVTVPGTTQNQGLASILFVSGTDTNSVSVSMPNTSPGTEVQCFIGSVKMPTGGGLNNIQLNADGQLHDFKAFTRFYCVPQTHWYQGLLNSNVNQFISVQFTEHTAKVVVVNATQKYDDKNPPPYVKAVGTASFSVESSLTQNMSWFLQGNGSQFVWINADSIQNTQQAKISLQSMAYLYQEQLQAQSAMS
jgi:hypothetical protein